MSIFKFQQFTVQQANSVHPIGTDSMILGAVVHAKNKVNSILDIGTGSGVLALMCAQHFPDAQIIGIDIDEHSTKTAQSNFELSQWSSRLTAVKSSLEEFESDHTFDLIVSNPPFFEETYLSPVKDRVRQRNSESLPLEELILKSAKILSPEGAFWLILPFRRKEESEQLLQRTGFSIRQDFTLFGKPSVPSRIIFEVGFESNAHERISKTLLVRNENGTYSEEYKRLTQHFHDRAL